MQTSKINIRSATLNMTLIAVFAALLCVLSPLAIPTPMGVAFTLQVFAVVLTGLVLKPLHALAAQFIYTLLGFCGLPVFAGYQSGAGVLFSPTGGFIVGFIAAAFFVSLLKGSLQGKYAVLRYPLTAIIVGIPCIYLPGVIGFMSVTGRDFGTAFMLVAATFIPVDLIKCALAAAAALAVRKATAGFY